MLPDLSPLGWLLVGVTFLVVSPVVLSMASPRLFFLPKGRDQDLMFTPPPDVPEVAVEGEDIIQYSFTWTFLGGSGVPRTFDISVPVRRDRYLALRREAREPDVRQWVKYATTPMIELDFLGAQFMRLHVMEQLAPFDQVSNVLTFVQACIEYVLDEVTHPEAPEYPKYALETLVDRQGDCEDQAILAAAVLTRLGFEAALVLAPGHMALGVACGRDVPGRYIIDRGTGLRYYYAETTGSGWRIGEVPPDIADAELEVLPVHVVVEASST